MRKAPRISVNDLANYMVASATAQHGIIRRACEPKDYVVTRYRDARGAISSYLADPAHKTTPLDVAEKMLAQRAGDPATGASRRDDAKHSIEAIHAIPAMLGQLAQFNFTVAPKTQKKLVISGVQVSVYPDLYILGIGKSQHQVGAAVLRMTKDGTTTPMAQQRRRDMGLYVATLIMMHMGANNTYKTRLPAAKLCVAIDVQHGKVFPAPKNYKSRINNLRSACTTIAALWNQV